MKKNHQIICSLIDETQNEGKKFRDFGTHTTFSLKNRKYQPHFDIYIRWIKWLNTRIKSLTFHFPAGNCELVSFLYSGNLTSGIRASK